MDTDLLSCYIGIDSNNDFGEKIKMKRMNKKILVIFAVLLLIACQASATVGILSVDVVPSQPLDTDLITFNIFGVATHDSSWVDQDVFSQNGTSLQLDLYVDMGIGDMVDYWDFSKEIQPLAPGTYDLEVRAYDDCEGSPFYGTLQDTYTVNFTVVPEPASLFLLGLGIMLARKNLAR